MCKIQPLNHSLGTHNQIRNWNLILLPFWKCTVYWARYKHTFQCSTHISIDCVKGYHLWGQMLVVFSVNIVWVKTCWSWLSGSWSYYRKSGLQGYGVNGWLSKQSLGILNFISQNKDSMIFNHVSFPLAGTEWNKLWPSEFFFGKWHKSEINFKTKCSSDKSTLQLASALVMGV